MSLTRKDEARIIVAEDLLKALLSGPAAENFLQMDSADLDRMWESARYLAARYISDLDYDREEQQRARLNQNANKART
jgi:hypothetical protein